MSDHFDCVVIGGGSAGYAAARTAKEAGKTVAIIDGGSELGGLCILRGCMPSKTLIYSTEILHHARQGEKFGLKIPEAAADMARMQARKREMIRNFSEYRVEQLQSGRFELIRETAHFVNGQTVELAPSGRRISADYFFVTTGSRQNWPYIQGLDAEGIWTSDEVLDLDYLPESVVVLGGGVVACELAQFLQRAGSKVTMIQRSPRILGEASHDAASVVEKCLFDEGIPVYTGTHITEIEKTGIGYRVLFEHLSKPVVVEAAHVFNALGRRPATDKMNLVDAGVQLGTKGEILVNEFQQSTNPHIYAAGDCCGPIEIVHLAIMQAETAAKHACGQPAEPVNYDILTQVVFTDPQIASAGLSEAQIKERNIPFEKASYPFDDHGKSMLMEAKSGYVAVFARKPDGLILGAECVGKDAGELIHALAVAITLKATCGDLLKTHWYHPTLSEIWSYPLEDLSIACK